MADDGDGQGEKEDPLSEADNDPFAEVDDLDDLDDPDRDPASDSDPDPDDDAPLADLAREVRERRSAAESAESAGPATDPDADAGLDDDPFESVDIGEVDDEAVWESFVEGEDGPTTGVGLGAEVHEASEAEEHVVPKREFCQQCPHFSAPPAATCTHEGTTIVEVVDADDFRVRNCPVVAERRESRID
jgi:hypothetical protein